MTASPPTRVESFDLPKISIKSYKMKPKSDKTITYFTIISTVKSHSFISKRNFAEFDNLQKDIQKRFSRNDFPNLHVPTIQILAQYSMDERMKILVDYLNALMVPVFMLPELMDFLNIINPIRETLLSGNEEFHREPTLNPNIRSVSIAEIYFNPQSFDVEYDNEYDNCDGLFQKYIEIQIIK